SDLPRRTPGRSRRQGTAGIDLTSAGTVIGPDAPLAGGSGLLVLRPPLRRPLVPVVRDGVAVRVDRARAPFRIGTGARRAAGVPRDLGGPVEVHRLGRPARALRAEPDAERVPVVCRPRRPAEL